MVATPWRDDPQYGGMTERAARKSWQAAQDQLKAVNRIKLVPFDEIKLSTSRRYLVKGLFPRVGMGVIWGEPKCGKSFWLYDLLMHVSLGWEYRGRRVHQGPVVYCCFEGQIGFEARKEAFCLNFLEGHTGHVPFYLMPVTLDLIKDHPALIKAIHETLGDQPPVAVALDTLNRSLVGSENAPEDMSAYIRASDVIRESFECMVPIVHHCGHDGSRPRGFSGLGGALDFQFKVSRDAANRIIVKLELEKDGPADAEIASSLEVVSVGRDEDGEEITSCVVKPEEVSGNLRETRERWPKGLKLVREVIDEAIGAEGTEHHVRGDGPTVRAVDLMTARRIHLQRFVSTGDGNRDAAERQAWKRNLGKAREGDLIGGEMVAGKELVWLINA